jgi:hypothetical protein
MKLYLQETPNDQRTWAALPTHNRVTAHSSVGSIELEESPTGDIFVEQWTDPKSKNPYWSRVSSDNSKSAKSDWVKRFQQTGESK